MASVNIARIEPATPAPRRIYAGGLILGLCVGLLAALAMSGGGLLWALLVVAALATLFVQPWSLHSRRLDRHHQSLIATRPLI